MSTPNTVGSIFRVCVLHLLCLCLTSIDISEAGETRVEYEGSNVVIEGEPFVIICRTTVFDSIKWQKDGRTIVPDSVNKYKQHDDVVDNVIKSHLSVRYAHPSQSGNYRCNSFDNESHHLLVLSENTITTNVDSDNPYKVLDFKTELVLECEVSGDNLVVTWLKDEEPLDKENARIVEKTTDKVSKLTIKRPMSENDAGNYTCKVTVSSSKSNGTELKQVIPVIVRPNLKLPPSSTAIEGEKMELVCSVVGRPVPFITWLYGNETYDRSTDRIELAEDPVKKVANAIFRIKDTRMEDHGLYTCLGVSEYGNSTSATNVRVKDKLAALWPFLGICAEVFVLCTIILIYEKKRNKTELEESDTDQSPEQKNTPEHGKDSVRQRK